MRLDSRAVPSLAFLNWSDICPNNASVGICCANTSSFSESCDVVLVVVFSAATRVWTVTPVGVCEAFVTAGRPFPTVVDATAPALLILASIMELGLLAFTMSVVAFVELVIAPVALAAVFSKLFGVLASCGGIAVGAGRKSFMESVATVLVMVAVEFPAGVVMASIGFPAVPTRVFAIFAALAASMGVAYLLR
jgi:hypothetical protein